MQDKSVLQFLGYEVDKMHFEKIDHNFGAGEVQLVPRFKKSVNDLGDDFYNVTVGIIIDQSQGDHLPFELCVELTGRFKLLIDDSHPDNIKIKKQLLNQNTLASLFPFLRSTVASLTLSANITPVMLPLINIAAAFNEKSEE